jgi:hydrogenase maturation protease
MTARQLIAGVGNIFFGDDGFGVEVVRRLARRTLPASALVRDYGIRGLHLAYALLDPCERLIVVDAVARGGPPGTLYVIEPETETDWSPAGGVHGAHGMDLPSVFSTVRALGGRLPPVRLVGCEAADVDERMELSEAVSRAVDPAADLVCELLSREPRAPAFADQESQP